MPHCARAVAHSAIPHAGSPFTTAPKAPIADPNSNECSSAIPRAKSGCTPGAQELANFTVPSLPPCWCASCAGTCETSSTDRTNAADGIVFETEYLRVPDEDTKEDDVVLEARRGDDELSLTLAEMDEAEMLGAGLYRLKSGSLLRFLSQVTVH